MRVPPIDRSSLVLTTHHSHSTAVFNSPLIKTYLHPGRCVPCLIVKLPIAWMDPMAVHFVLCSCDRQQGRVSVSSPQLQLGSWHSPSCSVI